MLVDLLAHIYLAPPRMRRLYGLTLTLGAVVPATMIAVLWLGSLKAAYADLQDRRVSLGNMLRIVEAGAKSESTLAATEQMSRTVFLQGASKAVAGASLQGWLGTVVQESGAQLQSIESGAPPEDKDGSYVGLSAHMTGSWKAVQAVIVRIETVEPMLTIQSVTMQCYSCGATEDAEPDVTMQISIRGAIRKTGS